MAQKQPKEGDPDAAGAASSERSAEEAAEAAMEQAQEAMDNLRAEADVGDGAAEAMALPDFGGEIPANGRGPAGLALLRDVNLQVKVVFYVLLTPGEAPVFDLLDKVKDIHAVLSDNKLGIAGIELAFSAGEGESRTIGYDDVVIQSNTCYRNSTIR